MAKPFDISIRNSLPKILVIILMLWLVFLNLCLEFKLENPICIICIKSSWSSSKHQRHLLLQFPPSFHFKPIASSKTRTFYKFILIDSNSVSIKYFKDQNDPLLNTHSTIQILKVLQPRHFINNLNEFKFFFEPFEPIGYTYWDYMDAWTKVFWHQNKKFKHSWLIYFKTNTNYNFPNWFL